MGMKKGSRDKVQETRKLTANFANNREWKTRKINREFRE